MSNNKIPDNSNSSSSQALKYSSYINRKRYYNVYEGTVKEIIQTNSTPTTVSITFSYIGFPSYFIFVVTNIQDLSDNQIIHLAKSPFTITNLKQNSYYTIDTTSVFYTGNSYSYSFPTSISTLNEGPALNYYIDTVKNHSAILHFTNPLGSPTNIYIILNSATTSITFNRVTSPFLFQDLSYNTTYDILLSSYYNSTNNTYTENLINAFRTLFEEYPYDISIMNVTNLGVYINYQYIGNPSYNMITLQNVKKLNETYTINTLDNYVSFNTLSIDTSYNLYITSNYSTSNTYKTTILNAFHTLNESSVYDITVNYTNGSIIGFKFIPASGNVIQYISNLTDINGNVQSQSFSLHPSYIYYYDLSINSSYNLNIVSVYDDNLYIYNYYNSVQNTNQITTLNESAIAFFNITRIGNRYVDISLNPSPGSSFFYNIIYTIHGQPKSTLYHSNIKNPYTLNILNIYANYDITIVTQYLKTNNKYSYTVLNAFATLNQNYATITDISNILYNSVDVTFQNIYDNPITYIIYATPVLGGTIINTQFSIINVNSFTYTYTISDLSCNTLYSYSIVTNYKDSNKTDVSYNYIYPYTFYTLNENTVYDISSILFGNEIDISYSVFGSPVVIISSNNGIVNGNIISGLYFNTNYILNIRTYYSSFGHIYDISYNFKTLNEYFVIDISFSNIKNTSATLTITNSPGTDFYYNITYVNSIYNNDLFSFVTTDSIVDISGLKIAATYHFTIVTIYNQTGHNYIYYKQDALIMIDEGPINGLIVSNIKNTSVQLSFYDSSGVDFSYNLFYQNRNSPYEYNMIYNISNPYSFQNLNINGTYDISINTIYFNGNNYIFQSPTAFTTLNQGPIRNIQAGSVTYSSAIISFTDSPGQKFIYELYYHNNIFPYDTRTKLPITNPYLLTNLNINGIYDISINTTYFDTVADNNSYLFEVDRLFTTINEGPITNLFFDNIKNTSAKIHYTDAPNTIDRIYDISYVNVYKPSDYGFYSITDNSLNLLNLSIGSIYDFSINTVYYNGNSYIYSAPKALTTINEGPIYDLSIVNIGNYSSLITFSRSPGTNIKRYDISYINISDSTDNGQINGSVNEYIFTDLSVNVTYDVSINTIYENGNTYLYTGSNTRFTSSPESQVSDIFPIIYNTSVTLYFTNSYGKDYSYNLYYLSTTNPMDKGEKLNISNPYTLTGLNINTTYDISINTDYFSNDFIYTTHCKVTTLNESPVNDLNITNLKNTSAQINFTDSSGINYTYNIVYYNQNTGSIDTIDHFEKGGVISNLSIYNTYDISINTVYSTTKNIYTYNKYSAFTTLNQSAPYGLNIFNIKNKSVDISFSDASGSVSKYYVTYGNTITGAQYKIDPFINGNTIFGNTISGLQINTTYDLSISSVYSDFLYNYFIPNAFTTLNQSAPYGLNVSNVKNESVDISFSDASGSVLKYYVTYGNALTRTQYIIDPFINGNTIFGNTISGLQINTTYDLSICSVYSDFSYNYSIPNAFRTLNQSAQYGLNISNIKNESVDISFSDASGSVQKYYVTYGNALTGAQYKIDPFINGNTIFGNTISGLQINTTYDLSISSVYSDFLYNYFIPNAFTTLNQSAPYGLNVSNVKNESVDISFSDASGSVLKYYVTYGNTITGIQKIDPFYNGNTIFGNTISGLQINTTYDLSICSVYSDFSYNYSIPNAFTTLNQSAPYGLNVFRKNESVDISFSDASGSVLKYYVTYGNTITGIQKIDPFYNGNTIFGNTISGLQINTTYDLSICSVYSDFSYNYSIPNAFTTLNQSAPYGLNVFRKNESVDISFSDASGSVLKYYVTYGNALTGIQNIDPFYNGNTIFGNTISGLQINTTYDLSICSVYSDFSYNYFIPNAFTTLNQSAPYGLNVFRKNESVDISFSDASGSVVKYYITYGNDIIGRKTIDPFYNGNTITGNTISGLRINTTYDLSISSVYSDFSYNYSIPNAFTTLNQSAPFGLNIFNIKNESVDISFSDASGSDSVIKYYINYGNTLTGTQYKIDPFYNGNTITGNTISELQINTTYDLSISSVYSDFSYNYYIPNAFTTLNQSAPYGLNVFNIKNESVDISFLDASGSVQKYYITYGNTITGIQKIDPFYYGNTITGNTISELRINTTYDLSICSVYSDFSYNYYIPNAFTTLNEGPIYDVKNPTIKNKSITFDYSTYGTVRDVNGTYDNNNFTNGNSTQIIFTGLTIDTSYTFKIFTFYDRSVNYKMYTYNTDTLRTLNQDAVYNVMNTFIGNRSIGFSYNTYGTVNNVSGRSYHQNVLNHKDTGNSTTILFTNLSINTEYTFLLTTNYSDNNSYDYTILSNYRTLNEGEVYSISFLNVTGYSMDISYSIYGSPINIYITSTDNTIDIFQNHISDLSFNTEYSFTIYTVYATGNTYSITKKNSSLNEHAASNFSYSFLTSTSITYTFNVVNKGNIKLYNVYFNDITNFQIETYGPNPNYTHTQLKPNTTYNIFIQVQYQSENIYYYSKYNAFKTPTSSS